MLPQPPPPLKHQRSRNEFGEHPLPSAASRRKPAATYLDPTRQRQRLVGRIRSETRGLFLDWRRLPILLGYSDQTDFSQAPSCGRWEFQFGCVRFCLSTEVYSPSGALWSRG